MRQELEIPQPLDGVGDQLVSTANVLRFLDVDSPLTLTALIADGKFPKHDCRLGRENRWFASTLRAWLVALKDERISGR